MIRKTLLVFAISMMLAYLLYPLVDAIDRRMPGKSNLPALVLPFLLILASLLGFTMLIQEPASREARQLLVSIHNSDLSSWAPFSLPVGEQIVEHSSQVLGMVSQFGVGRGLGHFAMSLLNLLVVPILSFLLLKDGRDIRKGLMEFFEVGDGSERFLRDAHFLMLDYMRALLILSIITLASFSVILSLLDVRYGVLLAFLACLLEFIPLVGPLITAAAILGACGLAGSSSGHLLVVAGFLLGYRVIQDYVFAPMVMRRGVQLHPLLVMFGIFAGGDIGGVSGILLSVPILALMRLAYYELRRRRHPAHNSSLLAVTA
jgi:predicted PurR-regulated permease PerM